MASACRISGVQLAAFACCLLAVAPELMTIAEENVATARFDHADQHAGPCTDWPPAIVERWAAALPSTTTLPADVAATFAELLAENDVTGAALLDLNHQNLKDLGISKIGHIKAVEDAISQLRPSQAPAKLARPRASLSSAAQLTAQAENAQLAAEVAAQAAQLARDSEERAAAK
eukprot:COSAG02_NODE_11841_length_1643_cov_4.131477_1_plen_174_part_01